MQVSPRGVELQCGGSSLFQHGLPSLDIPLALPGLVGGVGRQKQPQDSLCPQGLPWPSLRRERASWA